MCLLHSHSKRGKCPAGGMHACMLTCTHVHMHTLSHIQAYTHAMPNAAQPLHHTNPAQHDPLAAVNVDGMRRSTPAPYNPCATTLRTT